VVLEGMAAVHEDDPRLLGQTERGDDLPDGRAVGQVIGRE
jgi:hypothetical protein